MVEFSRMFIEKAQVMALNDIFTCEFKGCDKFLEKPYVLACGHFICIDHIKPKAKSFKCHHCNKKIHLQNKSMIHLKMSNIIDVLFNFNKNQVPTNLNVQTPSTSFPKSNNKKSGSISRLYSSINKRFNRLLNRKQEDYDDELLNNDSQMISSALDTAAEQYSSDESYNQLESTVKLDLSSIKSPNTSKLENTEHSGYVDHKPFSYLSNNQSGIDEWSMNLDSSFSHNANCSKIQSINFLKFLRSKPSGNDSTSDQTVYQGDVRFEEGRYIGELVNNQRNGYGTLYYKSGDNYEGNWLNDKKHGLGTYYFKKEECRYSGDWENDQRHGKGFLIENARSKLQIWQNGNLVKIRV